MKGHKGNHHRGKHASGGTVESEKSPSDAYAGGSSNVDKEAKERKRGGRAKKDVKMDGVASKSHAGRKPRKSGGKVGADTNPLSSAHRGTPAKGRSFGSASQ